MLISGIDLGKFFSHIDVSFILAICFFVLAIFVFFGKGLIFVAGYNTMPKEKRDSMTAKEKRSIYTNVSIVYLIVAVATFLGWLEKNFLETGWLIWISVLLYIAVVVYVIVFNYLRYAKSKKEETERDNIQN